MTALRDDQALRAKINAILYPDELPYPGREVTDILDAVEAHLAAASRRPGEAEALLWRFRKQLVKGYFKDSALLAETDTFLAKDGEP